MSASEIGSEVVNLLKDLNHGHLESAELVSSGSISFNDKIKPSVNYSGAEPILVESDIGSYVLNNIGKQYDVIASDADTVTIAFANQVCGEERHCKIDRLLFEELFLKLG